MTIQELKWNSDRIADPEGGWLWLAVDAFPDEASALAEADSDEAKIVGRQRMRLRWADENDEGDAYLMEEWGVTAVAEDSPEGDREFWSIQMFADKPGREKAVDDTEIVRRLADGEDPLAIDPDYGCTNPLTGYFPVAEVEAEKRRRASIALSERRASE